MCPGLQKGKGKAAIKVDQAPEGGGCPRPCRKGKRKAAGGSVTIQTAGEEEEEEEKKKKKGLTDKTLEP